MKITSNTPSVTSSAANARTRGPAAPAQPAESTAGERVDISSVSAGLHGVGSGEAPLNAARVAEIKQAISEGRFAINPERIADGLLASVRDMLGRANKPA